MMNMLQKALAARARRDDDISPRGVCEYDGGYSSRVAWRIDRYSMYKQHSAPRAAAVWCAKKVMA